MATKVIDQHQEDPAQDLRQVALNIFRDACGNLRRQWAQYKVETAASFMSLDPKPIDGASLADALEEFDAAAETLLAQQDEEDEEDEEGEDEGEGEEDDLDGESTKIHRRRPSDDDED